MVTLVSPGIVDQEFDLTQTIDNIDSTVGAFAGVFRWGPLFQPTLTSNEDDLVSKFFEPSNFNGEGWLTVSSFLAYGSPSQVVRVANTTANDGSQVISAVANVGPLANIQTQMVANDSAYSHIQGTFDPNARWIARYPGAVGNSLRVSVCDSPAAFSSSINLASANAVLAINVSSNVATVTITSASPTAANVAAIAFANAFTVTDLVQIGNSTIGTQSMKLTGISASANATSNVAIVTMNFQSILVLSDNFQSNTSINRFWEFYSSVDTFPGISAYQSASAAPLVNDEIHIVVTDDGGQFTGVTGSILEVYKNLSRAQDAIDIDGNAIWYVNAINSGSAYVWFANDRTGSSIPIVAANLQPVTATAPLVTYFAGGQDGAGETAISVSSIARGYDCFSSKEEIDIGLIYMGKARGGIQGEQTGNYVVDNIALKRRDVVVFRSPNIEAVVNNPGLQAATIVAHRLNCRYTSYAVMDSGYKQMYDKYNNVYRWVPLNGDIAGLCALTDYTNDFFWSPAGFNRGQIKNCVKLAYSPKQNGRDTLYKNDINPVVTFVGNGTVLYGDKTMLGKNSAFSRINVRRLFIGMEASINEYAKYGLFEFNDAFTRAQFVATVTPYLRDLQGKRAFNNQNGPGFYVKCDTDNNPGQVVDNEQFVATIACKPNRAINFMTLNFVAVGTDVAFSVVDQALGTALAIN